MSIFGLTAEIFRGIKEFAKKNAVMMIALCAAIATSFVVPPDREYLGYFDVRTLV